MNRKQRRKSTRKTHRVVLPAYYLLYCPYAKCYLADVDPKIQKLSFSEEALAAPIFTEEDAKDLALDIWKVSGLHLAVIPRYQPHTH